MLERFQSLNVEQEVAQIVTSDPQDYLDMNREQLMMGYDASGERLPPYRWRWYAQLKNQMNPQAGLGNPDYNYTGAMFSAMQLTIAGNEIQITSTVPYVDDLLARGGKPFGLNQAAKDNYISLKLYDELLERIKNQTGTL